MSKWVPYWGYSARLGVHIISRNLVMTFLELLILQKNVLQFIWWTQWTKNTDYTFSFLTDFLGMLPTCICCVHIFMDNTSSTNKNCLMMSWACEMVQQRKIEFFHMSFLIAGHTKFAPDLLFSHIAQPFNCSDVFTTFIYYLFIINTVQTSIWEYISTDTHKKHTYQYITLVYSWVSTKIFYNPLLKVIYISCLNCRYWKVVPYSSSGWKKWVKIRTDELEEIIFSWCWSHSRWCDWRDTLTKKYTKVEDICALHNFIFVINPWNNQWFQT